LKTLAQIISFLFHPCFIPCYATLIMFYGLNNSVYNLLTPQETKWRVAILVLLFTGIFPAISVVGLVMYKKVSNLYVTEQSERTLPYIAGALFYLFFFYFLNDVQIWDSLKLFILSGGVTLTIAIIINFKIKISAHTLSIGGLLGFILCISYLIRLDVTFVYASLILISGVIAWARLYLKAHQPKEIYLGFFVGLTVQLLLFLTFQKSTFA
jgi:hypothetical protein